MIRKALIGTAVAAVLGSLVFGRDVFSYAKTWGASVRDAVKSEVPLEFEVERARKMVENLVPEMRDVMHVIAEQQVDIEHLTAEINRKEIALGTQKEAILALRSHLASGKTAYVSHNRSYSTEEVRRDLAQRFERFKVAEATLEREQQILRARQKTLKANQDKLETLLSSKKDLEVQIAQLEARLKAVQAAETVSTLEIDDSQLSRAKQLIGELNKQLDVKEKMLDADGQFTGVIPVETRPKASVDVTREIDEYFGAKSSGADVAEAETSTL